MNFNASMHRPEKTKVRLMFNHIAPRYDLLNSLLSFGVHKIWKRKVIRSFKNDGVRAFLDVATGTADLALMAVRLKPEHIVGVDISEEMLSMGRAKIIDRGLENTIELLQADSENLPFTDNSFDGVVVGFGVRNFEDLEKGLSEMLRILRPGAKAVILEFSTPRKAPFRQIYHFYFIRILPLIGKLISKNAGAYRYLPDSVSKFPAGHDFLDIMKAVGYKNCKCKTLSMGIASIYMGTK